MNKVELFFDKVKEKLLKECSECKGNSRVGDKSCKCLDTFELYVQYFFRGITPKYWDLTLEDDWKKDKATQKQIVDYIEHLDNAYSYGLSLLFSGSNGVGKSMLMNIILKDAFKKGFKILYLDCRQLLDRAKFNDAITTDFLALDNFGDEQEFIQRDTYVGKIKELVWSRINSIKPTLISTNLNIDSINTTYGKTVYSYIVNTYKIIILSGADFRKVAKNEWESLLLS